jgi:hypothetical protein
MEPAGQKSAPSFQDVTDILRAAAASLKPGELISNAEYLPSESMNALELMDPKLDPGFEAAPAPVSSRIIDGSLPLHTLTPEGVLLVADKLLQLEVRQPYDCS